MANMNIGQAARATGISAKMIRHYEEIGLIPKPGRTASGYRFYGDKDLQILIFIRQARNLGFSIDAIRDLLSLWLNKHRSSGKVKALAISYMETLDHRVQELVAIKKALQQLSERCHGDDRPDCPILDGIEHGLPLDHSVQHRPGGNLKHR